MADAPMIRVRVTGATLDALRDFFDDTRPDLGCRPVVRSTDSGYAIDVYFQESRLAIARSSRAAPGVTLTVIENATEVGRAQQADVGQGNRFAARGTIPRGLARKTP